MGVFIVLFLVETAYEEGRDFGELLVVYVVVLGHELFATTAVRLVSLSNEVSD